MVCVFWLISAYKLIIYTIGFQMFLPPDAHTTDDTARRSQRKTKRIDRDRFVVAYTKQPHSKRHRHPAPSMETHSHVHSYCQRLMNVSKHCHQGYLLAEMGKALLEQSSKLFSLCKIKLKMGEEPVPALQAPPTPQEVPPSIEQLPESESNVMAIMQVDEFPWTGLHRAESAKMLCDNYENHELVYSVETLTPKLAREDLDFKLIEDMQ